jgi:nicotinate-nucleotide adenylyltransferase
LKSSRPIASDRARLGWLRAGLKGDSWAKVSPWEVDRQGPSYSFEAARHWKTLEPKGELYWILGSDQWSTLPRWKNYRELGGLVKFLVFPRPEVAQPLARMKMQSIPLRLDISATEIRKRVHGRLSIRGLVLPGVEKSLRRSRVYR